MKLDDEIKKILKDFRPLRADRYKHPSECSTLAGGFSVPGYIVKFIFLNILEFQDYGFEEKAYWHTFFNFKGYNFILTDAKWNQWFIYGERTNAKTKAIAKEMEKRIIAAAALCDRFIEDSINRDEEKFDYTINNYYRKILPYYNFYAGKTKKIIGKMRRQRISKEKRIIKMRNNIQKIILVNKEESELSKFCFPLILSFFSLLEFLTLAFFIFEQKSISFNKFKKFQKDVGNDWKVGFKKVFDIENRDISKIYNNLISIKKKYRNPLTHGFVARESIFVLLPNIGKVPLSYKNLQNNIHYGFVEFTLDDAVNIMNVFDQFLNLINEKSPFKLYIIYLKSGLDIPINTEEIKFLRKHALNEIKIKRFTNKVKEHEAALRDREHYLPS